MSGHTWRKRSPKPARHPEYEIVDAEGRYVASVQIRAHNNAGRDADLIAAAPELLAALRECLPDLRNYVSTQWPGPDRRLALAVAAIAKATGAQS